MRILDVDAMGGAIFHQNGNLLITRSTFDHNSAYAGQYDPIFGAPAWGGAIAVWGNTTAAITNCTFTDTPWLKVWTPTPSKPLLSRQVSSPYNYSFSDQVPADFEEFLGRLTHARRKNVRQERRRVREAGVSLRWLEGREIERRHWEFFNRCYRGTYSAHRSSPHRPGSRA